MVNELLVTKLQKCVVEKSRLRGVNREASQTAFYTLMTTGFPDLTELTCDHRLSMWLCTSLFPDFLRPPVPAPTSSAVPISVSEAEVDVAHYIGGFVCCKLKQRSKNDSYTDVIDDFVSSEEPSPKTLLIAKTRGRLLNLNRDGQVMFETFEHIFRSLFPSSVVEVSVKKYVEVCSADNVVQDCFHNSTHGTTFDGKDQVLSAMINLFFKVRVHQKCKVILDTVRHRHRSSSKEKALRSKLAK